VAKGSSNGQANFDWLANETEWLFLRGWCHARLNVFKKAEKNFQYALKATPRGTYLITAILA
jgi:hypothetical protein